MTSYHGKDASSDSATAWFKDASNRSGANALSDFNLSEASGGAGLQFAYSLEEWVGSVSRDPTRACFVLLGIAALGGVTDMLCGELEHNHDFQSEEADQVLDEYLGIACPNCLAKVNGHKVQSLIADIHMVLWMHIAMGDGAQFYERVLRDLCGCGADSYWVIWYGDKSASPHTSSDALSTGAPSREDKHRKPWRFWR
jgi:hypothetical protein